MGGIIMRQTNKRDNQNLTVLILGWQQSSCAFF